MRNWFVFIVIGFVIFASGCKIEESTDKKQRKATEQMAKEAEAQVGMPRIANFTERKFVSYLFELRDQDGYSTYTYIVDMNGGLHFVCESIGYGIPYSAQFVNPEKKVYGTQSVTTLPQPEPNGLFVPDGLSATWILCVDSESKQVRPIYSEPQLLVSPFPLKQKTSYMDKARVEMTE